MRFALPALIGLVAGACGSEPAEAPVDIDPSAVLASFGTLGGETATILSSPRGAAVSESGRYLVVVDRSAPFLRIVDREVDSAWTAAPGGDGPGEVRGLVKAEFEGDSVILALSFAQLHRFDIDGSWLESERLSDLALTPMSFTLGCGGVLLFGPLDGADESPWLHLFSEGAIQRSFGVLPGKPDVAYGRLESVHGYEDGVVVWHRQRGAEMGFDVDCESGAVASWSHREVAPPEVERIFRDGTEAGLALTLPDTLSSGAAPGTAGPYVAATWSSDGLRLTGITQFGPESCSRVVVRGDWTLHNASDEGLLLTRLEPVPVLQLVDSEWITQVSRPFDCTT